MGLFDKLFGKTKSSEQEPKTAIDFAEGDIFYTYFDGEYHLYKLLRHDRPGECYHVLCYQGLKALPNIEDVAKLEIAVYHAPIASTGFQGAQLFAKSTISSEDLIGYEEYIRQTGPDQEMIDAALAHYNRGNTLADQKLFEASIIAYTEAINIVPQFFEALDNRAFSKMDLGRWQEAIQDFELSLVENPDGFAAVFSIGECYIKMEQFNEAESYLQRALILKPGYAPAQSYLKEVETYKSS